MKIKNPIVNSIVYVILFHIICYGLQIVIPLCCALLGIRIANNNVNIVIGFFIAIVLFLIYVLIYRKKFNELITTKNFKSGFVLTLPVLLVVLAQIVLNFGSIGDLNFSVYGILFAIVGGLAAGISEEIMFRGVLISSFMSKIKKESYIPIAVLLSTLSFSFIHSMNLFAGADLNQTILQLIYAFGIGALFAAVFLRTANILVPILYHSFIDFIAFLNSGISQSHGVLKATINLLDPTNIIMIICSVVLLILAFYYVRSEKHSEIMELWNLKKI